MLIVLDKKTVGMYEKSLLFDDETNEYFIHTFAVASSGGPGLIETWDGQETTRYAELFFSLFRLDRKDME